jgi:hypothetical protein
MVRRDGEIGRRSGLKIRRGHKPCGGSIPPPGTRPVERENGTQQTYDPRRLSGVAVYQEVQREFSQGDRVHSRPRRGNCRLLTENLALSNELAILAISKSRMDSGREVRFNISKHPHLDHGYAVTSHSSQGQTADRVLIHTWTQTKANCWLGWACRRQILLVFNEEQSLCVQYGSSSAFQTFNEFLGILRLDSHFFQGCAKVLEEQVEVCMVQTVISGPGMSVTNAFPCIHAAAEEHGNQHNLPGPEVRHVSSFKEMAQAIILQDFVVEEFRSSLNSATSPDQVK